MKIIVLGAGQVGSALAENLVAEGYDITVVDIDNERLYELQNRIDIRTVLGPGSYPNVLKQAGAENADMLIAVTSSDETNIVACQVAYTLYRVPTKIARIRSRYYQAHGELFDNAAMPIDVWISPEQIVTNSVQQLIETPGSLQVLDFADGKVQLVSVKPDVTGPVVGKHIADLCKLVPEQGMRVAAIFRGTQAIPLSGDTTIEYNDEVFFVAAKPNIPRVMELLGRLENPVKRVMIAGGGNIGASLAKAIEGHYNVKLIERNSRRTQSLAEELDNTTVLMGDVSDRTLLTSENIEYIDVFIAVTNNDEVNIMSSLQAKRLGVRYVMTLVTKTAYVDLLEAGSEIDMVISPQQITIGSILKYIRRGDITNVYSLRRGAAEAIELIAHGDEETSKVVGRRVGELKLPSETNIGAIVRSGKVIMPKSDAIIESDDQVILFVSDKKYVRKVERLFQVSATFL